MMRINATLVLALLLSSLSVVASAQSNPQQLAEANRVAMDAYNNLDLDAAKETLEQAAKNAEKAGVKGPALARTYANLGVVYVGGFSDNAAGLDAFVKALQQDASVEPDPLVSTPDIQQVYTLAKRKVGSGGATATPAPAAARMPGPVEGNLTHVPAAEQLPQTGVPVYLEVPPDLAVAEVEIFYRSLGMPKPRSAKLVEIGSGFGYVIPCSDVFEPKVEYFIVAKDAAGKQVGNAGTPQNPVAVPIVATRTQPPAALPGQAPPAQCAQTEECPPGMPGCKKRGNKQMGDTCTADSECGEGLICKDDFCSIGERSEGDDEESGDAPRWSFSLGFVGGLAYVSDNMTADDAPPQAIANMADGLSTEDAKLLVEKAGWSCDTEMQGNQTVLRNCSVALDRPGVVPHAAMMANLNFHVTPRLYLGGYGRLAFKSGKGSLSNVLFGARIGYMITAPKETGFVASLYAGAGGGQIQVQPPTSTKGSNSGPFVVSGLFNANVGANLGYRFVRHLGLFVGPQAHFMAPTFLFDVDLIGGVEVPF